MKTLWVVCSSNEGFFSAWWLAFFMLTIVPSLWSVRVSDRHPGRNWMAFYNLLLEVTQKPFFHPS